MEVSAFIMGNLQLIVDSMEASTWPGGQMLVECVHDDCAV